MHKIRNEGFVDAYRDYAKLCLSGVLEPSAAARELQRDPTVRDLSAFAPLIKHDLESAFMRVQSEDNIDDSLPTVTLALFDTDVFGKPDPLLVLSKIFPPQDGPPTLLEKKEIEYINTAVKPALKEILGSQASRVDREPFEDWLHNVAMGRVSLSEQISKRFLNTQPIFSGDDGLLYRGEHSSLESGLLNSRLGLYSFGDRDVAKHYAIHPNNRNDMVESPRIIEAELTLCNLFHYDPRSSFVDMVTLRDLCDHDDDWRDMAISLAVDLCANENTFHWLDNFDIDHENLTEQEAIRTLIDEQGVGVLEYLDVDAYRVFDRPDIVQKMKERGYDGVVHAGNGESAMTREVKVFYTDQITPKNVIHLKHDGQEIDVVPCVKLEHHSTKPRR